MRWNTSLMAVIFAAALSNRVAAADEPASPTTSFEEKAAILKGDCNAPILSFGMDLMLGMQSGIRPNLALNLNDRSSLVVEGYYGGLFTKFGGSEAAGAGARWLLSRGGDDAVTFGPGVDVLFNLNAGQAVVLAPTIDLAWRHNFGNHAALVLGINAGVGLGLSGREGDKYGDAVSGKVTPLISFYTGLRY